MKSELEGNKKISDSFLFLRPLRYGADRNLSELIGEVLQINSDSEIITVNKRSIGAHWSPSDIYKGSIGVHAMCSQNKIFRVKIVIKICQTY